MEWKKETREGLMVRKGNGEGGATGSTASKCFIFEVMC